MPNEAAAAASTRAACWLGLGLRVGPSCGARCELRISCISRLNRNRITESAQIRRIRILSKFCSKSGPSRLSRHACHWQVLGHKCGAGATPTSPPVRTRMGPAWPLNRPRMGPAWALQWALHWHCTAPESALDCQWSRGRSPAGVLARYSPARPASAVGGGGPRAARGAAGPLSPGGAPPPGPAGRRIWPASNCPYWQTQALSHWQRGTWAPGRGWGP